MVRVLFNSLLLLSGLCATAQSPLYIPPLLTGPDYFLTMQHGTKTFWPGHTFPTMGFNGSILGPTLRALAYYDNTDANEALPILPPTPITAGEGKKLVAEVSE